MAQSELLNTRAAPSASAERALRRGRSRPLRASDNTAPGSLITAHDAASGPAGAASSPRKTARLVERIEVAVIRRAGQAACAFAPRLRRSRRRELPNTSARGRTAERASRKRLRALGHRRARPAGPAHCGCAPVERRMSGVRWSAAAYQIATASTGPRCRVESRPRSWPSRGPSSRATRSGGRRGRALQAASASSGHVEGSGRAAARHSRRAPRSPHLSVCGGLSWFRTASGQSKGGRGGQRFRDAAARQHLARQILASAPRVLGESGLGDSRTRPPR